MADSNVPFDVNTDGIELIVAACYDDIYRFCYWKTRDPMEAQDITQETFARFIGAVGSYSDIEKPRALLYTIAKNLCINWHRKTCTVSLDELEDSTVLTEDDFTAASIRKIYLSDAVSSLPDIQQEVLLLRFGQDLKVGEIAEILGISRFKVMYRLRGAIDYLRKTVKEADRQ